MRKGEQMAYKSFFFFAVALILAISGCATSGQTRGGRIDEIPMYGGMDRDAIPELKAGDEQFVASVSKKYGSRELASKAWVDQGFSYYNNYAFGMAMRRFNQAWLLDPENPEAYRGFGAVVAAEGDYCEAMRLMNVGLEKDLSQLENNTHGFLVDAALMTASCASDENKAAAPENNSLGEKVDELFKQAEALKKSAYLYDKWSRSLYLLNRYPDAWEKIFLLKVHGGIPDPHFLKLLRDKMPEPTK